MVVAEDPVTRTVPVIVRRLSPVGSSRKDRTEMNHRTEPNG